MKSNRRLVIVTPYRIKSNEELHNLVNYLTLDIDNFFKEIIVIARIKRTNDINICRLIYYLSQNRKVLIYPLSYYHGPISFIRSIPHIMVDVVKIICNYNSASFLFRGVDILSIILGTIFILIRKKYALQIIGDPKSVYLSLNDFDSVNQIFSVFFCLYQKVLVKHAKYIMYVTSGYLQKIYKPSMKSKVFSCTNLYLPRRFYKDRPRIYYPKETWIIVFVGSLEQKYKGLHILFYALPIVINKGYKIELKVVGDGKYRAEYHELARKLGINECVEMFGYIKDFDVIIQILDTADLFILPSLTEGLPRALIEAMARALPCIGSNAGGIPELLDLEDIVPAGDVLGLAERIIDCLKDVGRLNRMSKRNLEKARNYEYENIKEIRREFYRALESI